MMKECPNCHETYNDVVIGTITGYSEEITREFYDRRDKSDLCDDCLLDQIVAKSGEIGIQQDLDTTSETH